MKMKKRIFLPIFAFFSTFCSAESDFIKELNLSEKLTSSSESPDILEFKADDLTSTEKKCDAEMPDINQKEIEGGIESTCLQYQPKKYTCFCILKLHEKKSFSRRHFLFKKISRPIKKGNFKITDIV